jgi:hypothetical protein
MSNKAPTTTESFTYSRVNDEAEGGMGEVAAKDGWRGEESGGQDDN